jgi:hypothetical protein
MAQHPDYLDNVFINCPFDKTYNAIFDAIVFAIHDCGFIARCAREEQDSGDIRLDKLIRIIDDCKYGVHDISKADLDEHSGLARFNMPLELGLFMGCHRYAEKNHYNKNKRTLVMDKEAYRYQKFISDLAGTDISIHEDSPEKAINIVRKFLYNNSQRSSIASGAYISARYKLFDENLPDYCNNLNWDRTDLTFLEYVSCVTEWIKLNHE